jgi:hypothetical protein
MEAIVKIKFKSINGVSVNKVLLKVTPKLKESTEKTIAILCSQIKKYFEENKIQTKVTFELEDN